jgi:hypothetical protein
VPAAQDGTFRPYDGAFTSPAYCVNFSLPPASPACSLQPAMNIAKTSNDIKNKIFPFMSITSFEHHKKIK